MIEQENPKIEEKVNNLKEEIENLKEEVRMKNNSHNKNMRLKSDSNGKSNVLKRVSRAFDDKMEKINCKREEQGLDRLSGPKMTDLIIKHKTYWQPTEEDIINFKNEK